MSNDTDRDRRRLLATGGRLACGAAMLAWTRSAAAVASACATDNAAKEQREALHYAEASENPREVCAGCMFFQGKGRCGTCRMLNGTAVNPKGSCDAWVAKV